MFSGIPPRSCPPWPASTTTVENFEAGAAFFAASVAPEPPVPDFVVLDDDLASDELPFFLDLDFASAGAMAIASAAQTAIAWNTTREAVSRFCTPAFSVDFPRNCNP